jgi:RNA polymerase sigma-70 factor (ECF subfamily)
MGKEQNIADWFKVYGDELYRYARSRVNSAEEAADLVQDTFVSALKQVQNKTEVAHPKAYLYTLLKARVADYYRKAAKAIKLFAEPFESDYFDADGYWLAAGGAIAAHSEALLDDPDFILVFEACKQKLPNATQLILKMKYLDQLSSKEICQELDIAATQYWQLMHRAKLALRKCLGNNWK